MTRDEMLGHIQNAPNEFKSWIEMHRSCYDPSYKGYLNGNIDGFEQANAGEIANTRSLVARYESVVREALT